MIGSVIRISIRHRLVVILAVIPLLLWGIWSAWRAPMDAIPDLSDHQVIVWAEWPGRSPDVIANQVTRILSANLQGMAHVQTVRSVTSYGLAVFYVIFDDNLSISDERAIVVDRLLQIHEQLPEQVNPRIGPDGTGVGQVFWYTLQSDNMNLGELRALQDWQIRPQLSNLAGVAEVASVGGFEKEYQVDLDPLSLYAYNLSVPDVEEAVHAANHETGGNVLSEGGAESQIRSRGYLDGISAITQIPIKSKNSVSPVLLGDVAHVQLGGASRRGILDLNGEGEAVGGIVVMRAGENARTVIAQVKQRITEIEKTLPAQVHILVSYDRSQLIDRTILTLVYTLVEETALVILVHVLFLAHLRSVLIVTLPLPVAVFSAFIVMRIMGITSDAMSLGGIAIAIGVLVDSGIVIAESVIRRAEQYGEHYESRIFTITLRAAAQIGRPILYAMIIIVVAFMPVFALHGAEGRMYTPLAITKTICVLCAAILAITLVPALCTYLVRGHIVREEDNHVMQLLVRIYRPALDWSLSHKRILLSGAASIFVVAIVVGLNTGTGFMPMLDEGDLLYMPVSAPSLSVDEAREALIEQDKILRDYPEVESVLGKAGRADTVTDPAPLSMFETIIRLKPHEQWRPKMTTVQIVNELNRRLQYAGFINGWTMPIINRINMLSTGVRSDVGVKIYGADQDQLDRLASKAAALLHEVPGAVDVAYEQNLGANYLDIQPDRDAAARYGVRIEDIGAVIETALGGKEVTSIPVQFGRNRVRVRMSRDWRQDVDKISRIPIHTGMGSRLVQLGEVTTIRRSSGASEIKSDDGQLRTVVYFNVRGHDALGVVRNAQHLLHDKLMLPPGYRLAWSGEYEHYQQAYQTLALVIPLSLVVAYLLLFALYRSAQEAAHILLAIPFALSGGMIAVRLFHYQYSIAVWIGMIALFGTALQTAVIMVTYLRDAVDQVQQRDGILTRKNLREAVIDGALLRLRPKIMTVSTIVASLLPLYFSHRTGVEVMRPLAAPVIGGMVSSLIHVLLITPVLFLWIRERELDKLASGLLSTHNEVLDHA